MLIYDRVIKGNIVLENEVVKGSIGINGEKIEAIATNGNLQGKQMNDFSDKFIFPGAIDVHVHSYSNPDEGFEKTTRLAARGGVTTFIDMPYDLPNPINNVGIFNEKVTDLESSAIIDVALWGTIAKREGTSEINTLIDAGTISFKLSTFETDEYRFPRVPNDEIIKTMKILAERDVLIAFHSEDDDIVKGMVQEYEFSGKHYNLAHAESRPAYTETSAVVQLLEFAYWTGAKLHLAHISHPRTIDLINIYKKMGTNVSFETCYTYLLLDKSHLKKYGPAAKMNPPLREKEEVERMWEHLSEGNIDLISSDHIVWKLSDKEKGCENIFKAPSGLPGLEVLVPLMFDNMVSKRGFSPIDFAKVISTNAANRFNIKDKGKISVGYDADFMVIDPKVNWKMTQETIETDVELLPFQNYEMKGKVFETIVRGKTVFSSGIVRGKAGEGKFIKGSEAN